MLTDDVDLTWLITHGAGMAWQYAMSVQTALTDVDAAYAAENWPACVESCAVALRGIAYCERVGAGYVQPPTDLEHHVWLALADSPAARALRALPCPAGATRDDADVARVETRRQDEALRARLPVEIPVMRSATGYFPTVRVGSHIERLRRAQGMPPIDWHQWAI